MATFSDDCSVCGSVCSVSGTYKLLSQQNSSSVEKESNKKRVTTTPTQPAENLYSEYIYFCSLSKVRHSLSLSKIVHNSTFKCLTAMPESAREGEMFLLLKTNKSIATLFDVKELKRTYFCRVLKGV